MEVLTIPLWQHQYIIGYKMINHKFYDNEKHILKVLIHDSDSINIESKGIKYIWDAAEFPMDIRDYNWGYFNFLLLCVSFILKNNNKGQVTNKS